MRRYDIRLVVVSASCLDGMHPSEARRLRELFVAATAGVDIRVVGNSPFPPEIVLSLDQPDGATAVAELQRRTGRAVGETLVFGATNEDLSMAERGALYLHVGEEEVLDRSVRRTIPIWGQYATGVANALSYLVGRDFGDTLIEHGDVVEFVRRSIGFYESPDAVYASLRNHADFCAGLHAAFAGEIVGIFATGFPFYVPQKDIRRGITRTPPSILRYLREQEDYFGSKLIDEDIFSDLLDETFDANDAWARLGVRLDRNGFDLYEYTSARTSPPPSLEHGPLRELLASTAFNVRQDPWPCLLCVTLQAPDLHPDQRVAKDTNETCLRCRQTSLMLRNVAGSSVDLDMVVVVREDAPAAAERIKRHVLDTSEAHLYDLDLRRTICNYDDGPVDLFIATESDLIDALKLMESRGWLSAGFPTVALWSLTLEGHLFNLGRDFPVAFEPQTPLSTRLEQAFDDARRAFAQKHSAEEVVLALRAHSCAWRQLMSNEEVARSVGERLSQWRAA